MYRIFNAFTEKILAHINGNVFPYKVTTSTLIP